MSQNDYLCVLCDNSIREVAFSSFSFMKLSLLLFFFGSTSLLFSQKSYLPEDSIRIERLLQEPIQGDTILHFARQFIGTPYVAKTLDKNKKETLVINTRQLDCTTFVETILALSQTSREQGKDFTTYCRHLESLRYFDGQQKGYLSRLHYFTWWIEDNVQRGNIIPIEDKRYATASKSLQLYYMSKHYQSYPQLRSRPHWRKEIRSLEQQYSSAKLFYFPRSVTHLHQQELTSIAPGDLIGIVTSKAGLDYSHLGFAVWGSDGYLHLLNASSIHKKVVEEPMTLFQYLSRSPSRIGIRCFRWK